MKRQRKLFALAAGAFALGLLLGAGSAQAEPVVEFVEGTGTAKAIRDLELCGVLYDVLFRNQTPRGDLYAAWFG